VTIPRLAAAVTALAVAACSPAVAPDQLALCREVLPALHDPIAAIRETRHDPVGDDRKAVRIDYMAERPGRPRTVHYAICHFDGRDARGRPELADLTLTMNGTVATRPTEFPMPHWLQTGLLPRDPARGDRLERLVFKGDVVNLDPRFATDRFRDDLAALGVEFLIQPYVHETKSSGWHDYTDVDAVLAIRAIHPTELSTKPASKLINAWAAGVPAILGNEPAFRELRRDPLDYVEIAAPEEAIAAVRRLKEHPGDYRAMVDHGTVRATDYTNERVAERWHAFLSGPAETAYRSWLTTTPARREAEFVVRVARQKISLFTFKRQQSTR